MANSSVFSLKDTPVQKRTGADTPTGLLGGLRFHVVMSLLSAWFIGGIYIDGWAHDHGIVDTFFTPWHGILYSGYLATALALLAMTFINHRRGYGWQEAIPVGYGLSLLGVPLFIVGGVGDEIWHTLFGFEVGVEPLLSPTHLLLATSGIFMISGPLRAAWRGATVAQDQRGWRTLFPVVLSWLVTFSVFTFFTAYAHPFETVEAVAGAASESRQAWAVASIIVQAAIFMGFTLLVLRRWTLPVGALTLVLTLNALGMSAFHDRTYLTLVGFLTGVIGEVLLLALKPSLQRPVALRSFAFSIPVAFYLLYFLALALVGPFTWPATLWLGAVFLAGIAGLSLSYLVLPPQAPVAE